MRRIALVGGLLGAATALAAPSYAAAPQHLTFSFDESASSHVDGLGVGCPAFVGTLVEYRHDELAGILLADGTVHGRTYATSVATLLPDDPAATSYTGSYVLRETGTYADGGEDDWVETATASGTLSGSDGSSWRFEEVVHLSVSHDGTVRASSDRMHCGS